MFSKAIVRKPCFLFAEGITTANLGAPDYALALQQHRNYVLALEDCGLKVTVLDADENFPDSCFVEDVAVITDEIAVITNPGAPSRNKEVKSMIPVLEKFRAVKFIQAPGTLEGGDVMQVEKHFYVGVTARSNENGANQLGKFLSDFGYTCSLVPVTSALHFKTVVNYIGNNNLLTAPEFVSHTEFRKFNIIEIPQEELYSSNCIFIKNKLIVPAGFPKTKAKLLALGYNLIELQVSEFEKMDGGLTCLSLRFS